MTTVDPLTLIGSWRRFGASGPAYEVIGLGQLTPDGKDRVIRIRLGETGEEIDYTLNHLIEDEIVAQAAD